MASINKRGDKWQVRICRKNSPTICKTFTLFKDAQTWARKVELQIERGEALGRETVLLKPLLERYLKDVSPTKKGHKQEVSRLKAWIRHPIANREAGSIRPSEIATYRDERLKAGKSASSIRIELSLLSSVFRHATHDWGYSSLPNPVMDIRRPPPGRGRDRRLEAGELDAILAATGDSWLKPVVLFAVETAMRAGEICALEWENVDFVKRVAVLPDTKNGEKRVVPLSSRALTILRSLPHEGGKVFRVRDSHVISTTFRHVRGLAGVQNLRFHDLRHEAISKFFEKRLNLMEVSAISGHKSLQMLKRYTHLRAEDLALKLV
jgi:integrase